MEVLVHGEWRPDRFERLTKALDVAKQEAAGAAYGTEGTLARIAGEEIMVWPSGVRRGLYCSWCFTWQGMDFAVTNRCKSDGRSFGIHVTIGSLACMELGGEACWSLPVGQGQVDQRTLEVATKRAAVGLDAGALVEVNCLPQPCPSSKPQVLPELAYSSRLEFAGTLPVCRTGPGRTSVVLLRCSNHGIGKWRGQPRGRSRNVASQ